MQRIKEACLEADVSLKAVRFMLYPAAVLAIAAAFFILNVPSAHAAVGEVRVAVIAEDSSDTLEGAQVWLSCTGGALTLLPTNSFNEAAGTTSATGTLFTAPLTGSSCDDTEAFTQMVIELTGMVQSNSVPTGTYSSSSDGFNLIATTTMLYQVKVVVRDELGNSITASSLDQFLLAGKAASSTTSLNGFFRTTATNNILSMAEDGYVSATTTNAALADITTNSSTQLVITFASTTTDVGGTITATTTVGGLKFGHRIVVVDELGTALSPASVTAGANDVQCSKWANVAYCAVLTADDNTVGDGFDINADGYVSTTISLAANRTATTTEVQVVTTTAASSIKFGGKVTLQDDNSSITGATVTAGDGLGTTCTESSGVYYCAIPLADTSTGVQFVKSSYTTVQSNFPSDRTASSTAQQTFTYTQFHTADSGVASTPSKPSITGITIGDGSGKTTTVKVKITFKGSNILRYKIATSKTVLAAADYIRYNDVPVDYTLASGLGSKTLYLQFKSWDGGESSVFTAGTSLVAETTATPTPATPVETVPAETETAPAVPVTVTPIPRSELMFVPTTQAPIITNWTAPPDLTPKSITELAEGDLFMVEDANIGASVYWYSGGYKRPLPNEKTFLSWFPDFQSVEIKRVKKDEISNLAWGPSIPYKPGTRLLKIPDDPKVYAIQDDGTACHVPSEERAAELYGAEWGGKVDDIGASIFLSTYDIDTDCTL